MNDGDGAVDDAQEAERIARTQLLETLLDVFPPPDAGTQGRDKTRYMELYDNDPAAGAGGMFVFRNSMLMNRWRRHLDDQLKEHGQSLARWQALFELAANKPVETLTSIAARMGVVGPSLVGLFNELEADGLIERRCDPNDRRSKIILLTSEGDNLVKQLLEMLIAKRNQLLEGVEDCEIRLMLDLVERMSANLDRMSGSGQE